MASRLEAIQRHTAAQAEARADKTTPWIRLAGCADDGWSKEDEATATCYCGAVQLAFTSQRSGVTYLSETQTFNFKLTPYGLPPC